MEIDEPHEVRAEAPGHRVLESRIHDALDDGLEVGKEHSGGRDEGDVVFPKRKACNLEYRNKGPGVDKQRLVKVHLAIDALRQQYLLDYACAVDDEELILQQWMDTAPLAPDERLGGDPVEPEELDGVLHVFRCAKFLVRWLYLLPL